MNRQNVVLSGTVSLASGAVLSPPQADLRNPLKEGLWIDEIRFSVSNAQVPGGTIRARLTIGKAQISKDYVPIWNYGKELNPIDVIIAGGGSTVPTSYAWRLPKPLWVDPGDLLETSFMHTGLGSSTTVTARATYIGHYDPAQPRGPKIAVPWIAQWLPTAKLGASNYTQASGPTDLKNPFDVPLHIHRFIGRIQVNAIDAYSAGSGDVDAIERFTLLRMVDSRGKILVRDPTYWGHLFQSIDRAWTVNADVPAYAYFIAYLTQTYASLNVANTYRPSLSMVGYREVSSYA